VISKKNTIGIEAFWKSTFVLKPIETVLSSNCDADQASPMPQAIVKFRLDFL